MTKMRTLAPHLTTLVASLRTLGAPGSTLRVRGRPWRRLRARILAAQPLCVHCERAGRVTLATELDHRAPLSQGGTDDPENLDPICSACHAAKTAAEAAR